MYKCWSFLTVFWTNQSLDKNELAKPGIQKITYYMPNKDSLFHIPYRYLKTRFHLVTLAHKPLILTLAHSNMVKKVAAVL